jgi:hypothetical protein
VVEESKPEGGSVHLYFLQSDTSVWEVLIGVTGTLEGTRCGEISVKGLASRCIRG